MVGAPSIGGAIGGALGSAIGGKSGGAVQSGTQTVTQQQQLDPRIAGMLFGDGSTQGLLQQFQQQAQQPQNAGNAAFGGAAQNFLGGQGSGILNQLYGGASGLLDSAIKAPQAQASSSAGYSASPIAISQAAQAGGQAAPGAASANGTWVAPASQANGAQAPGSGGASVIWNQGAQVNAPGQNGLNLSGAYDRFVNGNAGANPYLTSALQAGVDQTNSSFNKNLGNLTDTLQKSILPSIRSSSILAGQYGGSRQGIAEGNAISDFTKQASDAALQLGQANSANTIGAQAQAFNQGQDRSLAATQGLGAQQYGVAGQNAAFQQQANLQNQSIANETDKFNIGQQNNVNQNNAALSQNNSQFNAGLHQANNQFGSTLNQNNNQFNAGLLQSAGQFGANLGQQNAQFNAGLGNQTALANLQAQLGTNSLNSGNQATGLQGLSGLLSQVYGYGQNQDNFGLNRAAQLNGLLTPYLSATGSSTSSQPTYYNPGGALAGGLLGGASLAGSLGNLNLGNLFGSSTPSAYSVSPGYAPVNNSLLGDTSWLNNLIGG